jgi:peptidoglycan/xylan/chitin deacetylase (PgdA/CDA1 family)
VTGAVKRLVQLGARGAEIAGLLGLLERAGGHDASRLRILTYHRVANPGDEPALHPGLVSATPAGFARQMEHLARSWRIVSLEEVLDAQRRRRPLPPRAVLLTFDDAYVDFAENAWPILRRLSLPATLFVPTAFPDRPERTFWWDRLHQALVETSRHEIWCDALGSVALRSHRNRSRAFKQLRSWIKSLPHDAAMTAVDQLCSNLGAIEPPHRVLGWNELRSLAREGLCLAPHTRGHPMLHRVSTARVREEARGSLEDLQREVGSTPRVLAYPSGGYDDSTVEALAVEGFELAFTTDPGTNSLPSSHPLRLMRIPVTLRSTKAVLRARMLLGFQGLPGAGTAPVPEMPASAIAG